MKFLVEWDPEARREIQAAGVADAVRMSLREAVEKTDRALALDPLQAGESRDDVTLRVAIFAPQRSTSPSFQSRELCGSSIA